MLRFFSILLCSLMVSNAALRAQMLDKPYSAPDFVLNNLNGRPVSLHSYKGTVVLVDFWASWCAPCRVINKKLIPLYEKYHSKGFEIISISVEANAKRWRKAIAKDKMVWMQLTDNTDDASQNLAHRWQIQEIPRSFLINEKGEFIAVNLPLSDLYNYLEQKFP